MTPELEAQMKKAFSLDSWVTIEGPIWTFQKPAAHIKQQGLIMAIVLPVVMGIIWVVLTLVGSGDPNGVLLVGLMWGVILAIPAFIGLVVGLRKVLKHEELSLASRRVLDVSSATGKLRIRQPNAMLKFIALERVEDAQVETLLAKVPPTHAKELKALGERAAAAMGTELIDTGVGSMDRMGMSDKTAGMLCWLPFQGIWLLASLYYVFMGKDRPFVRSCAIQSLAWFGVTLTGLFLSAVLMTPGIVTDNPVFAIPGFIGIAVFGLGNIGVRLMGCWKAYRGEPWVAPGLRPLMRRLMPPRDEL